MTERAARHALARATRAARRGRGRRRAAVPLAQAAVAEGEGAGRADLPPHRAPDAQQGAAHGLRGGELPQHRRVLGARHRHVHDPRRRLHAPLRLLQREVGRARTWSTAPSRCASPTPSSRWGCGTASSRRSTATTCPTAARASSPTRSARSARRAPGCAVEVLTPDFRGQEMPLARVIDARPDVFNHNVETVPRLYPKARRGSDFLRSCRVLQNAKRMDPERRHEVRPDGRPRRDDGRDARGVRDPARARGAGADGRPVPAPVRAAPAGRPLLDAGGVRRRWSARPTRWASSRSPPGRSCAARTTPTSRSRCAARQRAS